MGLAAKARGNGGLGRLGEQHPALLIEDLRAQVLVRTEQGVQLRTQRLQLVRPAQVAEQALAGLQLLVQGMAVEIDEVFAAEQIEGQADRQQHAGQRQHEQQAEARGEGQAGDHSGTSSR
ncbi:hypothetical protein D3C84_423780 [compost metagenome]